MMQVPVPQHLGSSVIPVSLGGSVKFDAAWVHQDAMMNFLI